MKASLSWINDYTPVKLDTDKLVDALTMAGLEVDSVTDRYAHLQTVVVGRIVDVSPHPNADRLTLCQVDIGDNTVKVVCGAPNVKKEMLAPLALPGTVFDEDNILEKTTIRGETSHGMLCSEKELRIGEDGSGIMSLSASLTPGTPLDQALALSDKTLDIDLTPNRPDCLSIIGIAREVAAIQNTGMQYPDIRPTPSKGATIFDKTSVTIEAPDHCPRYAARLIEEIKIGPSPAWLKDRLLSVGLRPINNVVDITNFVMMETGQPLHAFDFDHLEENRIVVRTAKDGEKFQTLDQKEHTLTSDNLMICDGKKPVAIGGVMGGLNSEIEDSTSRVLLESAYFSPMSIRKTAKRLGINTDASHRFERGVDPEGTLIAVNRAAQLMVELCNGTLAEGIIDEHPGKTTLSPIELSLDFANRVLGTAIPQEQAKALLESIEFKVDITGPDQLSVLAPTYRVDVLRPVDLIEEIARLYGYDNIPTTFPQNTPQAKIPNKTIVCRNQIKTLMTGLGFSEAINYSFIDSQAWDKMNLPEADSRRQCVKILNPLTEDQTVMRTMILPNLLKNMHRNLAQGVTNLKLFEIAQIFIETKPDDLPEETAYLSGLWTGARHPVSWHDIATPCDFFDLKGALEGLFDALKVMPVDFSVLPEEACYYIRPGYAAQIRVNNTVIGIMGEIHPQVLKNFDLRQTGHIFEIDLNALIPLIPEVVEAKPLPKYPAVARDFTLIVDNGLESNEIVKKIQALDEPLVENVYLFDKFEGKQIPKGKKSLSFRIRYRSDNRTLEDEEINLLHKTIADKIIDLFNAALPT